jgi:serine/threonine-protein kinase
VVAWAVGAGTAVAVGLLALSTVGTSLSGPVDPLAHATDPGGEPGSGTASPPPASPQPDDTSEPPTGDGHTLTSAGGTVVATCVNGSAYLVVWSPAQGFHAEDVIRGPARVARVKFESRGREIGVTVTCVDGIPQSSVEDESALDR